MLASSDDFQMTHKQRIAYQHMILGVFITGGGGVGKSALLKYFITTQKEMILLLLQV